MVPVPFCAVMQPGCVTCVLALLIGAPAAVYGAPSADSLALTCDSEAARKWNAENGAVPNAFTATATDNLRASKAAIDHVGVPFFLAEGSLLGWYRNCMPIPWDTDLDLGMMIDQLGDGEEADRKLAEIQEAMGEKGFAFLRQVGNRELGLTYIFERKSVRTDIHFFYRDDSTDEYFIQIYQDDLSYKNTYKQFELQPAEAFGVLVSVPSDTKQYLTSTYGDFLRKRTGEAGTGLGEAGWDLDSPMNANVTAFRRAQSLDSSHASCMQTTLSRYCKECTGKYRIGHKRCDCDWNNCYVNAVAQVVKSGCDLTCISIARENVNTCKANAKTCHEKALTCQQKCDVEFGKTCGLGTSCFDTLADMMKKMADCCPKSSNSGRRRRLHSAVRALKIDGFMRNVAIPVHLQLRAAQQSAAEATMQAAETASSSSHFSPRRRLADRAECPEALQKLMDCKWECPLNEKERDPDAEDPDDRDVGACPPKDDEEDEKEDEKEGEKEKKKEEDKDKCGGKDEDEVATCIADALPDCDDPTKFFSTTIKVILVLLLVMAVALVVFCLIPQAAGLREKHGCARDEGGCCCGCCGFCGTLSQYHPNFLKALLFCIDAERRTTTVGGFLWCTKPGKGGLAGGPTAYDEAQVTFAAWLVLSVWLQLLTGAMWTASMGSYTVPLPGALWVWALLNGLFQVVCMLLWNYLGYWAFETGNGTWQIIFVALNLLYLPLMVLNTYYSFDWVDCSNVYMVIAVFYILSIVAISQVVIFGAICWKKGGGQDAVRGNVASARAGMSALQARAAQSRAGGGKDRGSAAEAVAAAAAMGSSSSMPPGWQSHQDPSSGRTYYVNHNTSETSWTKPAAINPAAPLPPMPAGPPPGGNTQLAPALPQFTEYVHPQTGQKYFVNNKTKESVWQLPPGATATTANPVLGAQQF